MKKISFFITYVALACCFTTTFNSCTDLTEHVYHDVVADNYYNTPDEFMASIFSPWRQFNSAMGFAQSPWLSQELSGDGAAWPQKGRHGYDGGVWIRLHRHEWTPEEWPITGSWDAFYRGIGYANKVLEDIKDRTFPADMPITKEQTIAELRVYKAYCYLNLLDMFRNIPITETLGEKNPESLDRKEVFNYIEKEVKESINNLSGDKMKTYGRVSKWGAYALLARLYINAETYTGAARWDDCIAACNEVAKGDFKIDTNWNDPFKVNNDVVSKENIWVVVCDQIYAGGNGWNPRWLHYAHQTAFKLKQGCWNGIVVQPSFYDSFADNDKRKTEGFLIGTQYPREKDADGNYYFDTSKPPLKGSEEYKDQTLVLVNTIVAMDKGEENSGARSIKYEIAEGTVWDQDNDIVLFRYADVLFMKAEAMMRSNGNKATAEAVELINSVRQRSFEPTDWDAAKYTTTSLTMDELLAERGREFAFEGFRRSDLVRFDRFVTTDWWDKKASNNKAYNIFPIPTQQLNANGNLKPNEANAMF